MPPAKSLDAKPISLPLWLAGLAAGAALGRLAQARGSRAPSAGPEHPSASSQEAADAPKAGDTSRPFGERQERDEPIADQHRRSREPGRGRQATSAWQIPWAGWKDIAIRTYKEIGRDRVLAVAAGVVFYGLLALFPAITALVSSYALFAAASTISDQLQFLSTVMPEQAYGIVQEQVTRIVSRGDGQLSFTFLFGLALAIWSTNAGMKAIIDALNVIYGEEEKRGFFKLNLISLALTVGAIGVLLIAFGAVIVLPVVLSFLGLGTFAETLTHLARWPVLLLIMLFGLAVLYRFGPDREAPKWHWVSVGSIFATVAWLAGSAALSWYLSRFANYDATYGSLGAGIGLMMWLWMTSIVILVGAEINSEIEHQTARDTTTGPEKPIGARGAAMADTVGEAQD